MKTQITNSYTGQIGTFISHLFFTILFFGLLGFTQLAIAAPGITHNQCQPGPEADPPNNIIGKNSDCIVNKNPSGWKTGLNAGPFARGETIPYRALMKNTVKDVKYTLVIEYDLTKAREHAIDYLNTFNRTMINTDSCRDYNTGAAASICTNIANIDTFAIPIDPQVEAGHDGIKGGLGSADDITFLEANTGYFRIYGGTINSVVYDGGTVTGNGTVGSPYVYGADAKRRIKVMYTAGVNGTQKSGPVLTWGGHIAKNTDWFDDSGGRANPQGSPYHMRFKSWTCDATGDCSTGQQDRALTETAIVPAVPTISLTKTADTINYQSDNPDAGEVNISNPIFGATPGDLVTYSFEVTNTGNVEVSDVRVDDSDIGVMIDCAITLKPSPEIPSSTTCSGTYELDGTNDINLGSFMNTAKAYATHIVADDVPSNMADAVINFAPTLTLIKNVINLDGGTAGPNDFGISIDGAEVSSGVAYSYLAGTELTIDEVGLAGYSFVSITGDAKCPTVLGGTLTLAAGDNLTCTITNDDISPTLTVTKTVINLDGGTAAPDDFLLTVDGGSVLSGATNNFKAGAHTVAETLLAGYTAGDWGGDCAADGSITLALAQNATCTITNDDISPTLTVTKTVVNDNGGTAAPDDFKLTVDGGAVLSGAKNDFAVGAHTAAETLLAGYSAGVWGGDCASDGKVTLALGDNKTCTITNDDKAPSLTLVKMVTNDDGGSAEPGDWTLTAAGYDPVSPDAGTYDLSESGPLGYTNTSLTCDNSDGQVTSVTLGLGESVTCTFVNDDVETCLAGHRVTSVTLMVTQASPLNPLVPLSIKAIERKGKRITDVDIINVTGDYMDVEPNVTVFYVDPLGAAANFATQNLRFEIGPAGSEVASNMTVHLSCSDDPEVGDMHSGTAGAASATVQKVAFTTGPKSN